jgi:hypothetical protein
MEWASDPTLYPTYLRSRIRRGRGVGKGLLYAPWFKTRDVPSQGTSGTIPGIVVSRPFHFLSELEATYFFLIERQRNTIDLQEQWPILDIDETLRLSRLLRVRHPYRNGRPEPFTIDLLITSASEKAVTVRAASIKTGADAKNPQIKQRLTVEYLWCSERGIPWTLVDTTQFNKVLLDNLRFIRSWFRHRYQPDEECTSRFSEVFLRSYRTNVPLQELIFTAGQKLRLPDSVASDVFRYCAWRDDIPISLKQPLAGNQPLVLRDARVGL